jgi:3'(2'), 5'-bisphosphate nucleotidase
MTGIGSSLKFCLIAEGSADLYPRFGPTSEWDTAAGQAVLEAAGGGVTRLDGHRLALQLPREPHQRRFRGFSDPSALPR